MVYRGQEFPYVECESCGSLYCSRMPDAETLAQMYGPEYLETFADDMSADKAKRGQVVQWLSRFKPGTFLDYGCGEGLFLEAAKELNWQTIGVEFDSVVAESVARRTGARVVSDPAELGDGPVADVLHIGDVIEHLTDINTQMPAILRLLKPNGLLLAQGPLENNTTLFTVVLRAWRVARGAPDFEFPPYHVMLATAKGQRRLFRRLGLKEVSWRVREVPWPAPARLSLSDLRRPRSVVMFVLRRLSHAICQASPRRWGNRYFYVGRMVRRGVR